jgi:hypothetical protein
MPLFRFKCLKEIILFLLISCCINFSSVVRAADSSVQKEVVHKIGHALGKATVACEVVGYLGGRYCFGISISNEMKNDCSDNFINRVPVMLRRDFERHINSDSSKAEIRAMRADLDSSFANVDLTRVTPRELCRKYEDFANSTYGNAMREISSARRMIDR